MFGSEFRALPPAEEMVVVGWYNNEAQLALARDENGFVYVRLGRRQGALHVHPNLAAARTVIMRAKGGVVAPGLLRLRECGFRIFTRNQLRAELKQHAKGQGVAAWEAQAGADDDECLYALFKSAADPAFESWVWRGDMLMDEIERFESDARNKPVDNVGRTSTYVRILPLRDVLKTRFTGDGLGASLSAIA